MKPVKTSEILELVYTTTKDAWRHNIEGLTRTCPGFSIPKDKYKIELNKLLGLIAEAKPGKSYELLGYTYTRREGDAYVTLKRSKAQPRTVGTFFKRFRPLSDSGLFPIVPPHYKRHSGLTDTAGTWLSAILVQSLFSLGAAINLGKPPLPQKDTALRFSYTYLLFDFKQEEWRIWTL
jgi:hypothetical protein